MINYIAGSLMFSLANRDRTRNRHFARVDELAITSDCRDIYARNLCLEQIKHGRFSSVRSELHQGCCEERTIVNMRNNILKSLKRRRKNRYCKSGVKFEGSALISCI